MQKSEHNNAYKWNHHYLLLLLSRLTGGEIEDVVRYKTLKELSSLSGFTEKTVSTLLRDLEKHDLIEKERDYIFGRGRGVNSYRIFKKFKKYQTLTGFNDLIIDRIISSVTPPKEKYLLVFLTLYSDRCGVVRLAFDELIEITKFSRQTLQRTLEKTVNNGTVFGFCCVDALAPFKDSQQSCFYLNFTRYSGQDFGLPNKTQNLKQFTLVHRFNSDYRFVELDVMSYISEHGDDRLRDFLTSVPEELSTTFSGIIKNTILESTGLLLTELIRNKHEYSLIISTIRSKAMSGDSLLDNKKIKKKKLRKLLASGTVSDWSPIYTRLKDRLFDLPNAPDLESDDVKLKKSIIKISIELLHYITFSIFFNLVPLYMASEFRLVERVQFQKSRDFNLVLLEHKTTS